MSSNNQQSIQAEDRTEIDTAIEGIVREKRKERRSQDDRNTEAYVRRLLHEIKEALAEDRSRATEYLRELHYVLRADDDFWDLIDGDITLLADRLDISEQEAVDIRNDFRHQMRKRDSHKPDPPDPDKEAITLAKLAQALDYFTAIHDLTPRAEVTMEAVDAPLVPQPDEPRPVGRRRLKRTTRRSPEDASVAVPHESCDHILVIAGPRKGKDSTIVSIGANLKRQHGYKYMSVHDDGRFETSMLAIPNDEPVAKENLSDFDQEPFALDTTVYVPRMEGLPSKLPANHEVFTIGLETLTPDLILRLADITGSVPELRPRVKEALNKTLNQSGDVTQLVAMLQSLADEQDATLEWTEEHEGGDGTTQKKVHHKFRADKRLDEAASVLATLASQGLITSSSAESNLDMREVIRNNEKAAVLNCNFITGDESMKYDIIDLWLRLVMRVREKYPRLPRVAVELREIKNLAPSKVADVKHRDAIKALKQTLYIIASQGGSRRILLLGSTQKLKDVYKPIRTNMLTKILLGMDSESIRTLRQSIGLSKEQQKQLESFTAGNGMVLADGHRYWPVQFRIAPCGLGNGDIDWLDRYGIAWGARVRYRENHQWKGEEADPDYWVSLSNNEVITDDTAPDAGEWYLLAEDFPEGVDAEYISESAEVVEEVLEERREYEIPSDLSLESTGHGDRDRTLSMRNANETDERVEEVIKSHEVPEAIREWFKQSMETRQRYVNALQHLAESESVTNQKKWAKAVPDLKQSTLSNYLGDPAKLENCVKKEGKEYVLTGLGRTVLSLDWNAIEAQLSG